MTPETLGGIVAGLGLVFFGLWLLSENLKNLGSRRLRRLAASWAPNRFVALGWGVLAGGVTQSMAVLTFITGGILRAGLLPTGQAFSFILGGNIGTGLLVLFVSLDIELAALFAIGAASVIMVSDRAIRFRNVGAVLFGLGLMFVGIGLMKESVAPLTGQPWFQELLQLSGRSLWISFLGAAVLTFIVQSPTAVRVLGISMVSISILTIDQMIMVIYGSFIGSSLILMPLSWNLTGTSRRVVMFEVLYNFVACAICIPLLYVELWFGIPLLKALVFSIDLDPENLVAIFAMASDIVASVPFIVFLPLVVRFYSIMWPASATESISQPLYIHYRAGGDVDSSLELAVMEQRRVLSSFSSYLDAVRRGTGINSLRNGVRSVIKEIDEFLAEVGMRNPGHSIEGVNSVIAQQRLITWLEEQFAELCSTLNQLPNEASSGQLRTSLVEGIDVVLLVIIDALNARDAESWSRARELTGDRSELMRRLRGTYLESSSGFDDTVQSNILTATNTAGEIFFLLSRLTQEMEGSPALMSGEAPP